MAEAMLTSATTVKTTRNSGGSTTKAKCECAQQNRMKKSVDMCVWLRKMVWLSIGLQVAVSGKWHKGPPMAGQYKHDLTSGQYKHDLTAGQYFWSVDHGDCSNWFIISNPPPPICCPSLSFMGGIAKKI
jgi:hypothetical protein